MNTQVINEQINQHLQVLQTNNENAKPFEVCKALANCAGQLIDQNEIGPIKACMESMLAVYNNCGQCTLKTAIENVFIYTISDKILLCPRKDKMLDMFPPTFRNIMIEQMTATGI